MSGQEVNRPVRSLRVLRVGVAAGLVVSAVIHVQLAPGYQQAAPGGIGQGTLFLVQAGAAALAAVLVLLRGSRTAFAAATIVALSSLAAVVLYRYVQVPAIGPLPSMYEPVWYTAKTITALAEAVAGALAVAGMPCCTGARLDQGGLAGAGAAAPRLPDASFGDSPEGRLWVPARR